MFGWEQLNIPFSLKENDSQTFVVLFVVALNSLALTQTLGGNKPEGSIYVSKT